MEIINGIILLAGLMQAIAYGKKHFWYRYKEHILLLTDNWLFFNTYWNITNEWFWRCHVRTWFVWIFTFWKVIKSKRFIYVFYNIFWYISMCVFWILLLVWVHRLLSMCWVYYSVLWTDVTVSECKVCNLRLHNRSHFMCMELN